jgi:hypothetical protein
MELTHEEVRKTLACLQTDRAAGHSGWTNRLLRKLALGGTSDESVTFAARLTAVYNYLLTGKAPPAVRDIWTSSRLVFIPKDDTAYRPIGIGEILYRALGSTVIRTQGPHISTILKPHQLAVGVSGGVEIAAVLADLGYGDGDTGTMSIDVSNAFNSIRRRPMLEGLKENFPSITPFFIWFYGGTINLRGSNGAIIGQAGTGCLQGDPLSSLYFAAALQPTLYKLDETLRNIEIEQGTAPPQGLVVAIADDIMIQASTSALCALAPDVTRLLGEAGLQINLDKSVLLSPSATLTPNPPEGWTLLNDGRKTLGRPLGSREAQEAWTREALLKRGPSLRALRLIKPQCAYMILKLSTNHRFDYLRKVMSKDYSRLDFDEHDDRIDKALLGIAASPSADHLRDVRELPIDLGGLSMPSNTGVEAMQHYLTTQERTKQFLEEFYPPLNAVHEQKFYSIEGEHNLYTELYESAITHFQELADENEANRINHFKNALKRAARAMIKARAQRLHASLAASPHSHAWAAQLMSTTTPNAGQWLRCTSLPQFGMGITFSDNDYLEALRNRLLIPFSAIPGPYNQQCSCALVHPVNLTVLPMHPLMCPGSKGIVQNRHNKLRDCLAKLLRKTVSPETTRIEPDNHNGAHLRRRPDIYYEDNGAAKYIDLVVAEPTSQTYLNNRDLSSITHPRAAAILTERRKQAEYAAAAQDIDVEPFAVESTGRLGPSAQALLTKLCAGEDKAQALRDFLFELSFILAAAKGRLLSACRSRLSRGSE